MTNIDRLLGMSLEELIEENKAISEKLFTYGQVGVKHMQKLIEENGKLKRENISNVFNTAMGKALKDNPKNTEVIARIRGNELDKAEKPIDYFAETLVLMAELHKQVPSLRFNQLIHTLEHRFAVENPKWGADRYIKIGEPHFYIKTTTPDLFNLRDKEFYEFVVEFIKKEENNVTDKLD